MSSFSFSFPFPFLSFSPISSSSFSSSLSSSSENPSPISSKVGWREESQKALEKTGGEIDEMMRNKNENNNQ